MPDTAAPVAEFRGKVRILRTPQARLVTLIGASAAPPGEEIQLAFAGAAAPDLPEVLEDVRVVRRGPGTFDVLSGAEAFASRHAASTCISTSGASFTAPSRAGRSRCCGGCCSPRRCFSPARAPQSA